MNDNSKVLINQVKLLVNRKMQLLVQQIIKNVALSYGHLMVIHFLSWVMNGPSSGHIDEVLQWPPIIASKLLRSAWLRSDQTENKIY